MKFNLVEYDISPSRARRRRAGGGPAPPVRQSFVVSVVVVVVLLLLLVLLLLVLFVLVVVIVVVVIVVLVGLSPPRSRCRSSRPRGGSPAEAPLADFLDSGGWSRSPPPNKKKR